MNHLDLTPPKIRKARNRSLIQLGGLLAKSGLLEKFKIELGRDLQKDPEMTQNATTLYGALREINADIDERLSPTQRSLWYTKGKKDLAKKRSRKKKISQKNERLHPDLGGLAFFEG